jgi:hypothetical protein
MIRHTTLLMLGVLLALATPQPAHAADLNGDAIRAGVVGATLDGFYPGGAMFSETYHRDGRIDYRDDKDRLTGRWTISGKTFCTLYDGGNGGACWRLKSSGDNCFEFYLTAMPKSATQKSLVSTQWGAKGWRTDKPSTCEGRPTV